MIATLKIVSLLVMTGVAGIVAAGLFVMVRNRDGDAKRANILMRWRVVVQIAALALLGLLWATAYMGS